MDLRVKPEVDFMLPHKIEAVAEALLRRFENSLSEPLVPPVKVEFLAEDFLHFSLKYEEFTDNKALAYIDPNEMEICVNLARSDYFDRVGYDFTWAHEIGHSELRHFIEVGEQLPLWLQGEPKRLIYREKVPKGDKYYWHEWQANKFAGFLTMPKWLLCPEAQKLDLRQWHSVYTLAKRFSVSVSVMVIRLEELKLVYKVGKTLYGSEEEATGQLPLF